METVSIIGLGYVGLPLASVASKNHKVFGVDVNEKKVNAINSKICPIDDQYTKQVFMSSSIQATLNPEVIKESNIVVICVPTPVDENYHPNLNPLKSAAKMVAQNLQKGQLVIVESTIYPGTTQEVVLPILEESGLKAGVDFNLAYCPERIDPGNKRWTLQNIARVLGALTPVGSVRAKQFYSSFINADIMTLNSLKSAEAVKILENTFRDVNIAFINEMAKSFTNLGIDLIEVIRGASTKPFGFMPFYPGPGVGGHCIPVDPYYLIERAKKNGFYHQFLDLARKINQSMPDYVVKMIQEKLNDLERPVKGTKIGILGVAYKKGIDDTRESPALKVIEELKKKGAHLEIYDPFIPSISTKQDVDSLLKEVDVAVILTNHDQFTSMDLNLLQTNNISLVVDTRNCLNSQKIKNMNIAYYGIGGPK